MRIFARILWISTFLVATYSWMVAFEHGFAWKGFQQGFKTEWRTISSLLVGERQADAPSDTTPSS